jgi:hypothetical protein
VVTGSHLTGPAMRLALTALARTASPHGAIRTPVTSALAAHGRALLINVPLAGRATERASNYAPCWNCASMCCPPPSAR